jgi:hypothetical protein
MGEWVSTRANGAVGDGITDDTVAIQAALTASATNGVPLLGYPGDIYLVDALTYPALNQYNILNWNHSYLKQKTTQNVLNLMAGCRLENLGILGAGSAGTYYGSAISTVGCGGLGDLYVRNLFIQNMSKCLELEEVLYSDLDELILSYCDNAIYVTGVAGAGHTMSNSIKFSNLRIAHTYDDAIYINGSTNIEFDFLSMEGGRGRLTHFVSCHGININRLYQEGSCSDNVEEEAHLLDGTVNFKITNSEIGGGATTSMIRQFRLINSCRQIKIHDCYGYATDLNTQPLYSTDGTCQGLSIQNNDLYGMWTTNDYEPATSDIQGITWNWLVGAKVVYPFGPPNVASAGSTPACLDPYFESGGGYTPVVFHCTSTIDTVAYEGTKSWKTTWGNYTDGQTYVDGFITPPAAGTYYPVVTFWCKADADQRLEVNEMDTGAFSNLIVNIKGDGKWRFVAVGFPAWTNPASSRPWISQPDNQNGNSIWISKFCKHYCTTKAEADFWMQADTDCSVII